MLSFKILTSVKTKTLAAVVALFSLAILHFLAFFNVDARADEGEKNVESKWVRVRTENGAPVAFETSVARFTGQYVGDDGTSRDVVVDLIGAIHIADREYYETLNERFKEYDVVVFELVSDSDEVPSKEEIENENREISLNPLNIIPLFQQVSAKALNLTYQMNGIDYGAPNLRRGDCGTLELIAQTIANGDVVNFFISSYVSSALDMEAGVGEGIALALVCSSNKRLAARRLFARELEASEKEDLAKEELGRENAIIHFRNRKAIDVARRELDAGRERVGIFFGAGHMPHLAKLLETEFGLTSSGDVDWISAWDLTK